MGPHFNGCYLNGILSSLQAYIFSSIKNDISSHHSSQTSDFCMLYFTCQKTDKCVTGTHLCDAYVGVTAEWLSGHEAIRANQGGQYTSQIDPLNGGSIYKIHIAPLIHSNSCR